MARPLQDGLLYFPLDTDLFQDVKIKMLRTRHGCDGITVFLYLLCQIYRNGYYIGYSEDLVLIMAADLGISENEIRLIISFLLSRSLLVEVSTLAMPDTVLTSRGIQMRYQESKRSVGSKRQINVDADIWLLDDKETLGFIKVTENGSYSEKNQSYSEKNGSYSEKNDTNKSKLNKRKGNNNMHSAEESPPVQPEAETTGGDLKKVRMTAEIRQSWWDDLSTCKKEVILSLPNFDAAIFKEITGVDVENG